MTTNKVQSKQEEIKRGKKQRYLARWSSAALEEDLKEGIEIDAEKFTTQLLRFLDEEDVGTKGKCLGVSHPHLADYYTFEPLIEG